MMLFTEWTKKGVHEKLIQYHPLIIMVFLKRSYITMKAEMVCCILSIHNYHNLDHKSTIAKIVQGDPFKSVLN